MYQATNRNAPASYLQVTSKLPQAKNHPRRGGENMDSKKTEKMSSNMEKLHVLLNTNYRNVNASFRIAYSSDRSCGQKVL